VNKLPSPLRAPRSCGLATFFLYLLAALPSIALAQKPTDAPPAITSSSAPATLATLSQKQMLAQDSRLDRVLSLDIISVPINEVLQKESLDKSTDTMEDGKRFLLTASADCADLKLQVRLNARPLRTLMTALAEMVPGTWTRTPHGYQLSMTKDSVNARAEWWRLFLGEREKALAIQRQAVANAMQTKAERRKASDPDPEQSDLAVETDMADQHDFFHSLPPALKAQITATMSESAFYGLSDMRFGSGEEQSGAVGWLSQMSPQTQEKFRAAMQTNINRMAQAPPAYQKYAFQAQKDLTAFDPSKVYFSFHNGGFVVFAIPFNAPPSASTILELDVPAPPSTPLLMLNQEPLARAVQKMGKAAPEEWNRLAPYQRSRAWPNTLPKLPPDDHTAWHPSISRAAQTDWLGERGHMEYVCDYYSHGGYSMPEAQRKLPVKRPLAVELDEMAARRDVSWTKDTDGIYLVRNNRCYRDDNLEAPEPLLRRWFGAMLQAQQQEIARRQEVPQTAQSQEERTAALKQDWDWAAEVFSALTPWQIRNGLSLFQPEEKDLAPQNDALAAKANERLKHPAPNGIAPPGYDAFADKIRMPPFSLPVFIMRGLPHTIQLYSSLDDAGRTALLEGRLPPSTLSASQVAQAASLQPSLLAAMQNFPPASVFLGLLPHGSAPQRVVFGAVPPSRLEVSTPQSAFPQNAPLP